ncbi:MAG: pyridoxine 5'-phosphate synthase [Gemmatimonadaceae bacterium]
MNVDHVATVRQARGTVEPDPVAAARECEEAGADGITAHLREDRRHIQDADVEQIARQIRTVFNLEMACTPAMLAIAERLHPYQVTLVPERRAEVTTEGGLDLQRAGDGLAEGIRRLSAAGIRVSLFIDPTVDAVAASHRLGAQAIELHTGTYANAAGETAPLEALRRAAVRGSALGLAVHAGHGLTTRNVGPIAAIPEVEEVNIGHAIVGRAVFIGLRGAVQEMRIAMDAARARR